MSNYTFEDIKTQIKNMQANLRMWRSNDRIGKIRRLFNLK